MKHLLLLLGLLAINQASRAQTPNHYVFSQTATPYTELSGDTAVVPAIFGSGNMYWLQSLTGDTFSFFNQAVVFDTTARYIAFSTDGFVVIVTDTDRMMICDGLFRSLDSIDNGSMLSYKVEGSGNDKIVKVQWKNLKIRSGQPDNFVNFQIWIYKATGAIEYHYGPSSASNASGYTVSTGPSIGISYNDIAFTQIFEKIWLSNTPANLSIDTGKTMSYPNIKGVPPAGAVYRFVPRSIAVSVAHQEAGAGGYSIYPNPASGRLWIGFNAPLRQPVIVRVTDMQGRAMIVKQAARGLQQEQLDIRHLAPGSYLLHVEGQRGCIFQKSAY